MANIESSLNLLFEKCKQNLHKLTCAEEIPLLQARPPKSHGVYMLSFEGKLQYIGSSGNLAQRIRRNLLNGNEKSHTLINKLRVLRKWSVSNVIDWLKRNSKIKFLATETEDDARILEDALIAIYRPYFNIPLRRLGQRSPTAE